MPGKSAQILVSIILLGSLAGGAVMIQAAATPQNAPEMFSTASPNMFGMTVSNIYDRGVMVTNVEVGSRAADIGVRKEDVILAVNGEPVFSTDQFQSLIRELAGQPALLTVSRVGHINTVILDTR
jgi:S1-C subfamily serine protease